VRRGFARIALFVRGPRRATTLQPLVLHRTETFRTETILMSNRAQIIASYLSPYVRKVLVVLELKGIPYEVDPIVPFYVSHA